MWSMKSLILAATLLPLVVLQRPVSACMEVYGTLLDDSIYDAAFLPTGEFVIVRNFVSPHVVVFDDTGTVVNTFGENGTHLGDLNNPVGMGVDRANGDIFVVETDFNGNSDRIVRYSSNGTFLRLFGDGLALADVAADGEGHVYVCEAGNPNFNRAARMQKYTVDGALVLEWGASGPHQFGSNGPNDVAVDDAGNVFVTAGPEVRRYTASGAYVLAWALPSISRAEGIAIASNGDVIVADQHNGLIRRYTNVGAPVCEWTLSVEHVAYDVGGRLGACNHSRCRFYVEPATPVGRPTWGRLKTLYR